MATSGLKKFLIGYEDPRAEGKTQGAVGHKFYAVKISGSVTAKTKRILDLTPIRLLKRLTDLFSYAPAKTYGALFLTFGLLSLIINLATDYFVGSGQMSLASFIVGAALALLAVPLLIVDVPVSIMLQNFRPTEVVFFEFFCIKRLYYTGTEKALPPLGGIIIGLLLVVLGFLVPTEWIALGIGILIFVSLSFLSPEFTFFSSLLVLPYLSLLPRSSEILAVVALIGIASFVRKTIFGKRVIFFEQYDALVLLMVTGILLSGIFVKGVESFVSSLLVASAAFGYFLSSNMVTNRRLADCAINAVTLSSVPAAIVSVAEFINRAVMGAPFSFLGEGISSTFHTPTSAAAFFLVAVAFSAILVKQSHSTANGIYSVFFVLNVIALGLTGEIMALLALAVGFLAYLSIRTGRWMILSIPILLLLPYFLYLIPSETLASLPVRLFEPRAKSVILASVIAFRSNSVLGIGIGSESFVSEMEKYGVEGVTSCGNLFLELGLEAGAITLVAFLLLLVVRLFHRASYQRYIRRSQVSKISPYMSMVVVTLLVFGGFEYVFRDTAVLYLFWCVFGIGSGALRVAKAEHDDRVMYFEDGKSNESAVINLHIR